MTINIHSSIARLALAATAVLAVQSADAATVLTNYASGDIFIGFRQSGEAQTLVANLGSITKFLPSSLGGTWTGNSFRVNFGVVPGTSTAVTNLGLDLTSTFGSDWALNAIDGSSVRWAVLGITDNSLANTPINGYAERTAFVTKARTSPGTQSTTLGSVNLDNFAVAFSSFAAGIGGGSYVNQNSTENSSVAYQGTASDTNNWNTKIGAAGNFSLGSGRVVEQLNSGVNQGPTDSYLDFYVAPYSGSTTATNRTFTGGTFTLNANGELYYSAIPEPGSLALLGLSAAYLGFVRRRSRSESVSPTSQQ